MTSRTYAMKEAERMLPLLRAIRRELRDRTYEAARLEALMQASPADPAALAQLESELSTHRRELRRAERELADLGCHIDLDRPVRIVVPSDQGDLAVDGELAKTTIRRLPLRQGV